MIRVGLWLAADKRSNLVDFAEKEAHHLYFGKDANEYSKLLYHATMELVRMFNIQGHSGLSGALTSRLFYDLVHFKSIRERVWHESESENQS